MVKAIIKAIFGTLVIISSLFAQRETVGAEFGAYDRKGASFDPDLSAPVYLSFDMDALDPAFAPGVSHFEPGGLSVRDAITIIHRLEARLVGADIVEYNPRHDHHAMTAMVGAKLVKEIGGVMLRNGEG